MARPILGIADVGRYCLDIAFFGSDDNRLLRANHYRNDKNSGGLF